MPVRAETFTWTHAVQDWVLERGANVEQTLPEDHTALVLQRCDIT